MTQINFLKSKSRIIIISALIIALIAISVSAYIFKDKIFGQKIDSQTAQINQSQNPIDIANKNPKQDLKSLNNLALPFFAIQATGYNSKELANYEADKNPDKVYPEAINISKIYDQNNKELSSPQLKTDDKIVQDGDNYYVVRTQDNKKVELWNPKSGDFKTLEMPFEFDTGTFAAQNGKIYFSEYNYGGKEGESDPKCGLFNSEKDELGTCSIYEVDPTTLKSNVLVSGVSSQMYGGVMDGFLSKDSEFIWLKGETGDGGISNQYYKKYDAKTKNLIYTVNIQNEFSDQVLYFTQSGKKTKEITKIKCVDEKSGDPSVSICTSKQYADFDAEVYKLIPKEFYKSQDPALRKPEKKVVCGKYEIVDASKDPTQPDADPGKQVLYDGKSILEYKQLYFQDNVCVK